MLTSYEILDDELHVYMNGTIEPKTIWQIFRLIDADPRFECRQSQFWHIQNADFKNLCSNSLASIAISSQVPENSKVPVLAFVAESDFHYGMCRAYASWMGDNPIPVGVFRTYVQAEKWVNQQRPEQVCH